MKGARRAKISRILAPTDFSYLSVEAIRHATEIAAAFDAQVDVLHVWEPPHAVGVELVSWIAGDEGRTPLVEWAREAARKEMSVMIGSITPPANVDVASKIEIGNPAERIVEAARVGGHDLIVMGTHGRAGLSRVLLGSVAAKVLRIAPCPVLTVRGVEDAADAIALDVTSGDQAGEAG